VPVPLRRVAASPSPQCVVAHVGWLFLFFVFFFCWRSIFLVVFCVVLFFVFFGPDAPLANGVYARCDEAYRGRVRWLRPAAVRHRGARFATMLWGNRPRRTCRWKRPGTNTGSAIVSVAQFQQQLRAVLFDFRIGLPPLKRIPSTQSKNRGGLRANLTKSPCGTSRTPVRE